MMKDALKKIQFLYSFCMKRPVHINMQILYDCNFRCKICDFWKNPYTEYPQLTLAQVKIIADKLQILGPQVINIGGGEPLLHKDIVPLVEILSKNNFTSMICNGWYLTPEIARSLFDAGIYEISVSVDYASPQKHDEQRGQKGAFDRAIDALKILQQSRRHPYQRVHMISVVMDDNLDEIESLIHLSREIGVTYLVSLYSHSRGRKTSYLTNPDTSRHLLGLKNKYPEFVSLHGYLEKFSTAIRIGGITPCYAGKNLFNINSQGDITPCIDYLDNPVGNILTDDMALILKGLEERWRSNTCKGCWTSCRGSIETLMYETSMQTLRDYYAMVKDVQLRTH